MNSKNIINSIFERAKKAAYLDGVLNLLSWDQETKMPEGGAQARSEQISLVSGMLHKMRIDPIFEQEIDQVLKEGTKIESSTRIALIKMKKEILRQRALPQEFVEKFSLKTSQATMVWQHAKKESSWELFAPHLEEIVSLAKEKASYLIKAELGSDPYTVLMEEFEPDADIISINRFFTELKTELVPLVKKIREAQSQNYPKKPTLNLQAPYQTQKKAAQELITRIGYDWSCSRLDGSSHPFSRAIHPSDSRITIRSSDNESTLSQLMSALHEAGHSLYEMGMTREYYGTPQGEYASLSIHESQSRLWETVIGRSEGFMPILKNVIQKIFTQDGIQITDDDLVDLFQEILWVEPTYIRTESDEVTYPLHVLLRYEIEKELFSGKLQVQDLPQRWNRGMKELLGVEPQTAQAGCLQDIHWSSGMFGYFPTYTLGSWYAICFMKAMRRDIPNIQEEMNRGDFFLVHKWLQENIWSHGRLLSSKELVTQALGRPPETADYIEYLVEKYHVLAT